MKARQVDAFDGVFDNSRTGQREKYRDGRLVTYFRRGLNPPMAKRFGMDGPWGSYPDRPNPGEAVAAAPGTTTAMESRS